MHAAGLVLAVMLDTVVAPTAGVDVEGGPCPRSARPTHAGLGLLDKSACGRAGRRQH